MWRSYLVDGAILVAAHEHVGEVEVGVGALVEQNSLQLHEALHVGEHAITARLADDHTMYEALLPRP